MRRFVSTLFQFFRFTETARAKIEKFGGTCLTLDQLALAHPKGDNCVLLKGNPKARKAEKYFGRAPGLPGSTTKVRQTTETGRKRERMRVKKGLKSKSKK